MLVSEPKPFQGFFLGDRENAACDLWNPQVDACLAASMPLNASEIPGWQLINLQIDEHTVRDDAFFECLPLFPLIPHPSGGGVRQNAFEADFLRANGFQVVVVIYATLRICSRRSTRMS